MSSLDARFRHCLSLGTPGGARYLRTELPESLSSRTKPRVERPYPSCCTVVLVPHSFGNPLGTCTPVFLPTPDVLATFTWGKRISAIFCDIGSFPAPAITNSNGKPPGRDSVRGDFMMLTMPTVRSAPSEGKPGDELARSRRLQGDGSLHELG